MPRVRLIHSDPAEARDHAARLREAGYVVNHRQLDASWQVPLRRNPPDAVVIDLSRVPSMGRDVGVALRSSEGTRGVPIVFVGGDSKKLPGIKKLLPDATYTTWGRIRSARGRCDLAIWFPGTRRELEAKVKRMGAYTGRDGIWIAWPKQASGVKTDLTQTLVRNAGLAVGLVDFKICAIDETYSGLKFTRRKAKR